MGERNHFGDLDGMRGLLAVVVMLYHYGLNSILGRLLGAAPYGWGAAVDVFFVLSGFVICKSLAARPVPVAVFARKRLWRLFPMHLAILVLFAPLLFGSVLFGPALSSGGIGPGGLLLEASALAPLVMVEMHNFPAWSMGFEFYLPILFWALFGVLLPRLVPHRVSGPSRFWPRLWPRLWPLLGVILLLPPEALLLREVLTGQDGALQHATRAVCGLGLGFCIWRLHEDRLSPLPLRWPGVWFLLTVLLFPLLVLVTPRLPALGLLMAPLLSVLMLLGARSRTVLSSAPVQWLGRLSFGIYMVHVPMLLLFERVFGRAALAGDVALKGLLCLSAILAAWLLHRLVERPAMRLGRRGPQRSVMGMGET